MSSKINSQENIDRIIKEIRSVLDQAAAIHEREILSQDISMQPKELKLIFDLIFPEPEGIRKASIYHTTRIKLK